MESLDLFSLSSLRKDKRLISLSELRPMNDLKGIFREIRDYFAGNVTGITRDEKIAQNIMRLLFCKIYDERISGGVVEFANRPSESSHRLRVRINNLFEEVKRNYPDIFERNEEIELIAEDLSFVVGKLEDYSILQARRDVIGDAFEELIGTAFRGGEGQFFTPRNVVAMMVNALSPQAGDRIIDPACGSGGFLAYTLGYFHSRNETNFHIAGIDKDRFLATIAKIYLSLIGNDDHYHVYCENSLENPAKWRDDVKANIKCGEFDIVITNPPFGAKIPVLGNQLLRQYQLGHQWQKQKQFPWRKTGNLHKKQAPQVLFIERCLQLLREGGKLGIVLPDGVFGNPSDRYIWEYIASVSSVIGVVSLPQETFQPSTHTKTSVLFLEKTTQKRDTLFMAIANSVGHNKNGKSIYKVNNETGQEVLDDDTSIIAENFADPNNCQNTSLGFHLPVNDSVSHIYVPKYYNPEIQKELDALESSGKYFLKPVGELVDAGILQITRGNEIGSRFYGTGDVPFIRTSDIVNWEIKFDPIKSVAEEVYDQYKDAQDIQEKDILFVSDGTFLIGRTAIVTHLDLKIIIQSHLKKIRVLREIDPYYLFYLLNTKPVRKQIDAKTFVQATISTVGNRLNEVVLPINKDPREIAKISREIESIVFARAELREKSRAIIDDSDYISLIDR